MRSTGCPGAGTPGEVIALMGTSCPDQCQRGLESAMKAKDVMTRNVITIAPHAPILAALQLMQQHNISGLPASMRSVIWWEL
jgi:CBS domain-containing protein